jgi:hypothetical protein
MTKNQLNRAMMNLHLGHSLHLQLKVLWTGLQTSGELQDKTRHDNTRELRVLLIHQLVLVCWKVVPHTISFYNPEPY